MLTLQKTDDYTINHLSASSGVGHDPDSQANRILRKFGFQTGNGNAADLYRKAEPPAQLKGSFILRVGQDGERGYRAEFILRDGCAEIVIDRGRVLYREAEEAPSFLWTIEMEGNVLAEWEFHGLPVPEPCAIGGNGKPDHARSTPPLMLDESVLTPTAPIPARQPAYIPVAPAPTGPSIVTAESPDGKKLTCEACVIRVDRIRRFNGQPRKHFRKQALREKGESMLQENQQQPITVIRVEDDPSVDYEIVDGEMRWRAAQLVGIKELLAIVKDKREIPDKITQHRKSLVANFCRENHSNLETLEALLIQRQAGVSPTELARMCGKPVSWVYKYLVVERLIPDLKKLLDGSVPKSRRMSLQLAYVICHIPAEKQMDVYDQISGIRSAKLRLLKAESLVKAIAPPRKSTGRKKKPGDYVQGLIRLVPRMLADCMTATDVPKTTFECLIRYQDVAVVQEMLGHLDETVRGLQSLRSEITATRKKLYG